LIQEYLEDTVWHINKESTLNFTVPKNKIVLSNTIGVENFNNNMITIHLDLLIKYIKRNFNVNTCKYMVAEDNKYKMCWLLFIIRFI
jgi:hypothetical protein